MGEYRSDVNYGNGVRLLGSSLSMDSKDGHGHYFDQILLNTEGLGNDPYQFVSLRIQKNGLYRYDMIWRLNAYYNPGLTVAGGLHLDGHGPPHTGPRHHAVSTIQIPCARGIQPQCTGRSVADHLAGAGQQQRAQHGPPVFSNLRRQWNEYRLGGDAEVAGFKSTVLRRWDFYKEDPSYACCRGPTRSRSGCPAT